MLIITIQEQEGNLLGHIVRGNGLITTVPERNSGGSEEKRA